MIKEIFVPVICPPQGKTRSLAGRTTYPAAEDALKEALRAEPIGTLGRIDRLYLKEEKNATNQ